MKTLVVVLVLLAVTRAFAFAIEADIKALEDQYDKLDEKSRKVAIKTSHVEEQWEKMAGTVHEHMAAAEKKSEDMEVEVQELLALRKNKAQQLFERLREEYAGRNESITLKITALENELERITQKQNKLWATSCEELLSKGKDRGLIELWLDPTVFVSLAFCEGPWLVIQKRYKGNVDFFRDWDDYRNGFGDVKEEHWLGLETVRWLTSAGTWDLEVDLLDKESNTSTAIYHGFSLGNESSFYPIHFLSYKGGNAGNSLEDGPAFSTKDRDHDPDSGRNCAQYTTGAWWYSRDCLSSNLNGQLRVNHTSKGVLWHTWSKCCHSLVYTLMKIRKV